MKRYVIIFIALIFTQLGYAQEQEVEDTPKLGALLVVDTLQHNFGVIDSRGSDVHYSFYIENRGDSPLVISRVEKSCSCIKTHLSNKPLAVGERREFKVTYEVRKMPIGVFSKSVILYTNSRDCEMKRFTITGRSSYKKGDDEDEESKE